MDWIKRLILPVLVAVVGVIGLFFLKPVIVFLCVFIGFTLLMLVVWGILYGLAKKKFGDNPALIKSANIILYFWAWWLYLLNKDYLQYLLLDQVLYK